MKKGIFITMEGPDGSGKSTQIELLKAYLEEKGYDVLITREPGGTRISEAIRGVILNREYSEMSPVTEMLLYASARAQLISEVVGPALESGKAVISDRFVDSSLVYQGMARGLGVENVYEVRYISPGPSCGSGNSQKERSEGAGQNGARVTRIPQGRSRGLQKPAYQIP